MKRYRQVIYPLVAMPSVFMDEESDGARRCEFVVWVAVLGGMSERWMDTVVREV